MDFFVYREIAFPTALEQVAEDLSEPRTEQCDLAIRSLEREFFPQARRDQARPPEASQKHSQCLDAIMPAAGIIAVSGAKNCGAERHGRQPVAQISKLRLGT
jgi:hypothetical protein